MAGKLAEGHRTLLVVSSASTNRASGTTSTTTTVGSKRQAWQAVSRAVARYVWRCRAMGGAVRVIASPDVSLPPTSWSTRAEVRATKEPAGSRQTADCQTEELRAGLIKAGSRERGAGDGDGLEDVIRFAVGIASEKCERDGGASATTAAGAPASGSSHVQRNSLLGRVLPLSAMMPHRRKLSLVLMSGIDGDGAVRAALHGALDALFRDSNDDARADDGRWLPDDIDVYIMMFSNTVGDAVRVEESSPKESIQRCSISYRTVIVPLKASSDEARLSGSSNDIDMFLFGWLMRRQLGSTRIAVSKIPFSQDDDATNSCKEVNLVTTRLDGSMLRSLGPGEGATEAASGNFCDEEWVSEPNVLHTYGLSWKRIPKGVDLHVVESISMTLATVESPSSDAGQCVLEYLEKPVGLCASPFGAITHIMTRRNGFGGVIGAGPDSEASVCEDHVGDGVVEVHLLKNPIEIKGKARVTSVSAKSSQCGKQTACITARDAEHLGPTKEKGRDQTAHVDGPMEAVDGRDAPASNSNPAKRRLSGSHQTGGAVNKRHRCEEVPRDKVTNKPILPVVLSPSSRVLSLGRVVYDRPNYHNANYIWCVGYTMERQYASVTHNNSRVTYRGEILENGDSPLFKLTASDNPGNPIYGDTATSVWQEVVRRVSDMKVGIKSGGLSIAAVREDRALAAEQPPPGMKTGKGYQFASISGPEYFGISSPTILRLIEELPDCDKCVNYEMKNFQINYVAKKPTTGASGSRSAPVGRRKSQQLNLKPVGLHPPRVHQPLQEQQQDGEDATAQPRSVVAMGLDLMNPVAEGRDRTGEADEDDDRRSLDMLSIDEIESEDESENENELSTEGHRQKGAVGRVTLLDWWCSQEGARAARFEVP